MSQRTALITGASSGLGAAMAERFRREGFRIITVSRSEPEETHDRWIRADLTRAADRQDLVAALQADGDRLDVLINNAGVGLYETWAETDEDELRRMLELNVMVPILLSQAMLPLLKNAGGTIINTASVAGKMPVACMGGYCASKYALTAFSDTLRMELAPHGVHVINLVVGRISTGFGARTYGSRTPPPSPAGGASASGLADRVWRAYRGGRREVVYPRWYRLAFLLQRFLPGTWDALNRRQWGLS